MVGCLLVEIHVTNWDKAQREDLTLSRVLNWLKAQKQTNLKMLLAEHAYNKEGKLILWNRQNFLIHQEETLYLHLMPKGKTEDLWLFMVPRAHHVATWMGVTEMQAIKSVTIPCSCCRKISGGWDWLPKYRKSLKICSHCLQHEGKLSTVALHLIVSTAPMDLLHVDFTSIKTTMEQTDYPKVANILVFQDHFMKHVMVYISPDWTAKTVAKFLYQGYILIFGAPARLPSNCSANVMNNIISEIYKLLDMRKLQTMPYHPYMNGLVERSHQTIMQMIGKLGEDKKADWPGHLAEIVHAYNATWYAVMGYSPHYLMFWCRPRLPVNFYFPTLRSEEVPK